MKREGLGKSAAHTGKEGGRAEEGADLVEMVVFVLVGGEREVLTTVVDGRGRGRVRDEEEVGLAWSRVR